MVDCGSTMVLVVCDASCATPNVMIRLKMLESNFVGESRIEASNIWVFF